MIEKIKNDIIHFEKEEIDKSGKLYDGVIEGLKRLKSLGYILCICSNGNEKYIMQISNKYKFNKVFDTISFNNSK